MTKIEDMSLDELSQVLIECQKALAELKESKKEGKWLPKEGEEYWFRDAYAEIDYFKYEEDDEGDNWRVNNMPVFKTAEECEKYWHFMDTVKEKSYEFSKEEWEKHNIRKYTIYYDFNRKEFGVDRSIDIKYLGEIYFKTEEDCQYIIDNFKDELMEYWI